YLDSNRFLSNLPGSTVLFPVVDMTRQYINGLMYLLTEEKGHRPTFVDDRNFYRPAGVKKWVRNGFLNKGSKLPLGVLRPLRTQAPVGLPGPAGPRDGGGPLLAAPGVGAGGGGPGGVDPGRRRPAVPAGQPPPGHGQGPRAGAGLRVGDPPLPAAGHPPLGDL